MSAEGNERIQFVWIGAFLAREAQQVKSLFVLAACLAPLSFSNKLSHRLITEPD